jgi:hypothetical protein
MISRLNKKSLRQNDNGAFESCVRGDLAGRLLQGAPDDIESLLLFVRQFRVGQYADGTDERDSTATAETPKYLIFQYFIIGYPVSCSDRQKRNSYQSTTLGSVTLTEKCHLREQPLPEPDAVCSFSLLSPFYQFRLLHKQQERNRS